MLSAKRKHAVTDLLSSETQIREISNNSDIVTEILLRLSIKDVLRFKCVCKQWLSIISDPLFCHIYRSLNPRANIVAGLFLYELKGPHQARLNFVFLNGETFRDPFHSLNFTDASSDIQRIWSCNGLLCLCLKNYEIYSLHNHTREGFLKNYYYICNPTTKQSTRIPNPKRPLMSSILSITLAFDPRKSVHYKVVCVWVFNARYQISVYSSETRLWKDVLSWEVGEDDNLLFEVGVFWNNAVNWVSTLGRFMCFDVDNECLKKMPDTPILAGEETRTIGYFGESWGHLHLVEFHRSLNRVFDVVELQKDYSEWLILHRLSFSQLCGLSYPVYWKLHDISILAVLLLEEEGNTLSLVVWTPGGTILYCISDGTSESCCLRYKERHGTKYKWYQAHQYIMSLAAV